MAGQNPKADVSFGYFSFERKVTCPIWAKPNTNALNGGKTKKIIIHMTSVPPTRFKIWLAAIRPKTLPASIAPVALGTAMAFGDGVQHWPTAVATLFAALMIQIGTNFANDYFDFKKGADTSDRRGPVRVVQSGLVSPKSMQSATVLIFLFAALACYWLYLRAGTPVAVIGISSILCGVLYTAGPYPLGYLGLGEILVLVFFGPVAVAGTYYVQSFEMNPAVMVVGFMPGLFSTAILVVNNLRDIPTDRKAGKKTLAVRFGPDFARFEYFLCLILAALLPIVIYKETQDHLRTLWTPFTLLLTFPAIKSIFSDDPKVINRALGYTGLVLIAFTLVYAWGWIL